MALRRLTLLLLIASLASPACADDGAIQGVGGVIELLDEHPTIVMEKMDVVVDLGNAEADVNCTFVFHNTGPALDVRMGFPEEGGGVDVDVNNPQGFRSFTSWVDGEEVPTTVEGFKALDDRTWKRWRVKTVHFHPDQHRVVRVLYPANFGAVSTGEMYFAYHLHTGASWKGPIGRARVRLNFNHDRGRGDYNIGGPYRLHNVDDPFRPCGPRCYEWTAEELEPGLDHNVMVTYTPFYRGVRSDHPLPYEDFWAARPVTPYIEDGRLWLPVQHVAARVGAELTVELAEASLRRGPHRIQLSANSDVMTTDVGPRRLPRPTRVAHGHLVVPAAPVLRALGATVTWDDQEQTITVSCPEAAPLEARVTDDHLYAILGAIPDGFAPPRPESYAADIGEHFQDPASPPWLAIGDFAGDGVEDVALFLQKGSQTGIGIVERANGGHFSFHWLPGSPHEATTLLDGTFFTVIQTRPPGEVAYYQEGETTPKSGRLRLGRDSLEVIAWGKAAVVYYWDADGEQYKSVVTAD